MLETQLQNCKAQMNYYRLLNVRRDADRGAEAIRLQSRLNAAREKMTPDHPEVRALEAELLAQQNQLADLERQGLRADPQDQKMMLDLEGSMNLLNTDMQNNDLQMEETQKQLAELNRQILTYQSRIQATPHLEQQYAALMRDDGLAKQNYQEIVERLEAQSTGARSVVRSAGPTLISRREPEYTDAARKARIQGTVELSVTIGTDGVPRDMRVIRGLNAGLDQKAMDCVTGWRFRPASRDGQAITAFATVEVKFSLPVK